MDDALYSLSFGEHAWDRTIPISRQNVFVIPDESTRVNALLGHFQTVLTLLTFAMMLMLSVDRFQGFSSTPLLLTNFGPATKRFTWWKGLWHLEPALLRLAMSVRRQHHNLGSHLQHHSCWEDVANQGAAIFATSQ